MNLQKPMFSAENEQCVIGALLIDNGAIDFIGGLKPEHFFIEDYRVLFSTAILMIGRGIGCDVITLAEELADKGDERNWLATLGEIQANTPSSKNIARYAQIVMDRATERAIVVAADTIAGIAHGPLPTTDKVDQAQATVMSLADGVVTKEPRSITSILSDVVQRVQDGMEGKIVRNLSPWPAVDARGRVVIVVDDGLATGATMVAALHAVRAQSPQRLICALPVAAPDSLARVEPYADEIVCLDKPWGFRAVGQFYQHFDQVEDEEVVDCLRRFARRPAAGSE